MKKKNRIIYWIATIWLALGMLSTGIVQLFRIKEETDFILELGYPEYLLTLLGLTKIIGVIILLVPRLPLLKEWVYAGFIFTMTGALFSHLAKGNGFSEIFPPLLLVVLIAVSWRYRPADRKLVSTLPVANFDSATAR